MSERGDGMTWQREHYGATLLSIGWTWRVMKRWNVRGSQVNSAGAVVK